MVYRAYIIQSHIHAKLLILALFYSIYISEKLSSCANIPLSK